MVREISDKRIYKRFEQEQHTHYLAPIEEFEPYLVDNLSSLVLCPKCLQPHGKLRLRDKSIEFRPDGKKRLKDNSIHTPIAPIDKTSGWWVEQHCGCEKEPEITWGGLSYSIRNLLLLRTGSNP